LEENNITSSSSQSLQPSQSSQSQSYQIGIPIGLSHTFQYEDAGYYNAGYTIYFEDDAAASCSKKTFRKLWVLKMERTSLSRRCEWIDVDVDETTQVMTTTTETPTDNEVEATEATATSTNNIAVETSQEVTTPTNNEVVTSYDSNYFPTTTSSTTASCNIHYTPSCSVSNVTATSTVYFLVQPTQSNQHFETFNATVIFHWDSETITTGSQQYRIGDPIGVSNTHSYETNVEGKYNVGYSLVFESDDDDDAAAAAAGCSGKRYDAFYLLEMIPRSRCFWEEWETSVSSSSSSSSSNTLALVGGSPPTSATLATTAAALVDASMPSGIPMASNVGISSNNGGSVNNEGENTTTTSEPTVSLSPTDIPPANKTLDSNGATSGDTMGFFLLYHYLQLPVWSIVVLVSVVRTLL